MQSSTVSIETLKTETDGVMDYRATGLKAAQTDVRGPRGIAD